LKNFDFPYFSKSIPEFWKKWHISLSSWFRDYVYIPLGGSKVSTIVAVRNVFIVFLLSAFWHGANWTYIAWGMIHTAFFLPGFVMKKKVEDGIVIGKFQILLKTIATFSIVTLAWVFFRSSSVSNAFDFCINMFKFREGAYLFSTGTHLAMAAKFFVGVCFLILIEYYYLRRNLLFKRQFGVILLLLIVFLGAYRNSTDFIYFQF
jgi:alginate O-acetyltransferase complex protein AlgI